MESCAHQEAGRPGSPGAPGLGKERMGSGLEQGGGRRPGLGLLEPELPPLPPHCNPLISEPEGYLRLWLCGPWPSMGWKLHPQPGLLSRLAIQTLQEKPELQTQNNVFFACNLHVPCFYLVVGNSPLFPICPLPTGTTKPPCDPSPAPEPCFLSSNLKVKVKRPLGSIWLPDVF